MGSSDISWTIRKSFAPRSRQIITPAAHHSIFTGRMLFLISHRQYRSTVGIKLILPSVLWHCWLGGRKGIRPVKKWRGRWRWALVSPDAVAPSRMVCVSASVNLPLHHTVRKFSSGTGSSQVVLEKKGRKTVVLFSEKTVHDVSRKRRLTSAVPLRVRSPSDSNWLSSFLSKQT